MRWPTQSVQGRQPRRQRRLAQPAFHRQRIAGYGATMADYALRLTDRWKDGQSLDIAPEMNRVTLAVATRTLFDADVDAEAGEIGEALTDAIEAFNIAILPFAYLLDKLPLPTTRRLQRSRARLDETIYRIIAERRESGVDRGDPVVPAAARLLAHERVGVVGLRDPVAVGVCCARGLGALGHAVLRGWGAPPVCRARHVPHQTLREKGLAVPHSGVRPVCPSGGATPPRPGAL